MAELIDKWDVVSRLISLENEYQFFKGSKDALDAEKLYRRICELEIAIGKIPGSKWIPANGWSQRKNCASCAHASDTHFAEACGKCVVGEYEGRRVTDPSMWKPRTKADRIRAMTDEELAKLLYEIDGLGYCKNLPECGELLDTPAGIPEEKCIGCMLNWLRQPAEVG